MAAPIKIALQNYYILLMPEAVRSLRQEIAAEHSVEVYEAILEFAESEIFAAKKFNVDRLEEENLRRLMNIITKRDWESLDKYLHEDKGRDIQIHYYRLLEVLVYICSSDRDNIVNSIEDGQKQQIVDYLFSVFVDRYKPQVAERIRKRRFSSLKLSDEKQHRAHTLAEYYNLYLTRLEEGAGTRHKIAQDISRTDLRGEIKGVRQAFQHYDKYFDKLGDAVSTQHPSFELSSEMKFRLLLTCISIAAH